MMEEGLHGEFRLSLLDRRGDDRRKTTRLPGPVRAASLCAFHPVAQYGLPLWALPVVRLAPPAPRCSENGHIGLPTGIGRIVAAIRLWRGRAGARQHLRVLSDHMLKAIGLRRENVGYEFRKSFWHYD
jgi:uncharacterized protein YjiS (DUF1127 family)